MTWPIHNVMFVGERNPRYSPTYRHPKEFEFYIRSCPGCDFPTRQAMMAIVVLTVTKWIDENRRSLASISRESGIPLSIVRRAAKEYKAWKMTIPPDLLDQWCPYKHKP